MNQEQTEQILRDGVERAFATYRLATERFTTVFSSLTSDLLTQDEVDRLQHAARERRSAVHNLAVAARRLSDYLLTGQVPGDLRDPGDKPS